MTKSRGVRGAAGGCAVASLVYLLARGLLTLLVSALMGLETMQAAYAHAIAGGYRFYSYGDASLLLPEG